MSGGRHAVTTGSDGPSPDIARATLPAFAPVNFVDEPRDTSFTSLAAGRRTPSLAALAILALGLAWSGFFLWTQREALPLAPREVPALVALWAVPLLLLGIGWLLLARGGLREAAAFRGAARELDQASKLLETRLATTNRELSLAREFVAAQARDLESVGRVAAERLTGSGEQLRQLVEASAERVETIRGVSHAALDNMEQLRAQLPVLISATRDLGNTIGSAGETARGHVVELDHALARVGETGAGSRMQVEHLQRAAGEAVAELGQRADQLAGLADRRFDALGVRSGVLGNEAERIASALSEAEAKTLARWRENAARVEADIGAALVVLDNAERDAFAASQQRLLALSDDAERVDALLDERRRAAMNADEALLASFTRRVENLDGQLADRQAAQVRQGEVLAEHADAVACRLERSEARLGEILARSREARDELAAHVRDLIAALADGRETLAGTDGEVRALLTSSERLRDLLDAAAARARDELPDAIGEGEARLGTLHEAITSLRAVIGEADERGRMVATELIAEVDSARALLAQIGERQSLASADAITHLGQLDAIDDRLRAITREMSEVGSGAFERALRVAAAETSGRIEQAAAHAAGVGSEAAAQLRSEIARVEQQAAALEARVASAQSRAETPLDRDFARRAALITETLNSNAIDIAGALGQEAPDTAWAAYLRGDRGVFARRAVRLLDGGQSRAIVELYETEAPFREHVSRFIHDFEALLRELLSARDGHVLAVTMLSSDLGKLYVALAQAIERLRS